MKEQGKEILTLILGFFLIYIKSHQLIPNCCPSKRHHGCEENLKKKKKLSREAYVVAVDPLLLLCSENQTGHRIQLNLDISEGSSPGFFPLQSPHSSLIFEALGVWDLETKDYKISSSNCEDLG